MATPCEVACVSVQVREICRHPGSGRKEGHTAFFVRALCGHESAGNLSFTDTTRSATWCVDPPGSPLGRVVWEDPPWVELRATELATDLVLQLRRTDDGVTGSSEGSVRGELCLPLSALVHTLLEDNSKGTLIGWYELLPPRARGASWHEPPVMLPPEGAPGFLRLAVKCTLVAPLRTAYMVTPYTPPPDRNLNNEEPRHPELGIAHVGDIPRSWERVHRMTVTVCAGVALSPLRTMCFLQTWREPMLNVMLLTVGLTATTRAAWRFVPVFSPIYLWLWMVLSGRVMLALRAAEPRRTWGVAPRGPALHARVVSAAVSAVQVGKAVPGWISKAIRVVQTSLIIIGEGLEQLDNALAWEDPCATRLLLGTMFKAACTSTILIAIAALLPWRTIVRASALVAVTPAAAATYRSLLAALDFVAAATNAPESFKPHFLSGLSELKELTDPASMTVLDRAVRHPWAATLTGKAKSSAPPKPLPHPSLAAQIMNLFSRVPTAARAAHMRVHFKSLVPCGSPEYDIHSRLVVSYNPVVQMHHALHLDMELHVEDVSLLAKQRTYAADGRVFLEYRLQLAAGDAPCFHLEALPPVAARHPWLARSACTPAAGLTISNLVEASMQAQPIWRGAILLQLSGPTTNGNGAGSVALLRDGQRTALMLRMRLNTRIMSIGPVPLFVTPSRALASGTLSISSLPAWLAPPELKYDVMLSYRDVETGTAGDGFALQLAAALRSLHNLRVFIYADACAAGDEALCPVPHGVQASTLFVPVCSPGYAHPHHSPCSGNELLAAVLHAAASRGATPLILPVWHSGIFPPEGAAPVLAALPQDSLRLRMPRQHSEDASAMANAPTTVLALTDPVLETAAALAHAVQLARKGKVRELAAEFGDAHSGKMD
jgi:hypothetical protein